MTSQVPCSVCESVCHLALRHGDQSCSFVSDLFYPLVDYILFSRDTSYYVKAYSFILNCIVLLRSGRRPLGQGRQSLAGWDFGSGSGPGLEVMQAERASTCGAHVSTSNKELCMHG